MRRLIETLKRWIAGMRRRPEEPHDTSREFNSFFGS